MSGLKREKPDAERGRKKCSELSSERLSCNDSELKDCVDRAASLTDLFKFRTYELSLSAKDETKMNYNTNCFLQKNESSF